MRISDWSSDVCSSDLGKRGKTKIWSASFDPGKTIPRSRRGTKSGWRASSPFQRTQGCSPLGRWRGEDGGFPRPGAQRAWLPPRSEEHTSELQSLMRISYAAFCLKKITEHSEEQTRLLI